SIAGVFAGVTICYAALDCGVVYDSEEYRKRFGTGRLHNSRTRLPQISPARVNSTSTPLVSVIVRSMERAELADAIASLARQSSHARRSRQAPARRAIQSRADAFRPAVLLAGGAVPNPRARSRLPRRRGARDL